MSLTFPIAGTYVNPTNGVFKGSNFELLPLDPLKPADQYVPTLSGNPGLNWFDSKEKVLYVVVKGPDFIEIRTTNVIQVCNHWLFMSYYRKSSFKPTGGRGLI